MTLLALGQSKGALPSYRSTTPIGKRHTMTTAIVQVIGVSVFYCYLVVFCVFEVALKLDLCVFVDE